MSTLTRNIWTAVSWNVGDDREVFPTGHGVGHHIGVVKRDQSGTIIASVSVVLVPEHADEEVANARGFETTDNAREWVETTIYLLTD